MLRRTAPPETMEANAAKVRVLAFIWNVLNALWLGYLIMRRETTDMMQIGEMALAIITLGALLFFALGNKKA